MKPVTKVILIYIFLITVVPISTLYILKIYPFSTYYGPITTKVVDAETGEPIEGAVVMAEWTNTKGMPGLSYTVSYKVEEVITDSEGVARLKGIPKGAASLDVVAVYKKGYVLWSDHNVFAGSRQLTVFEWKDNYVFEMARFKPEYSYDKHKSFIHSAIRLGRGDKKAIAKAYHWEGKEASKERDNHRKQLRRSAL